MINFIYARSLNGVIGHEGKMPWHIPEDLEVFKAKTKGSTVVMGRKTWDSLPEAYKPLPDRKNIVVSTNSGALLSQDLQPHLVVAPDTIVELVKDKDVWIIGGAETFQLFMPYVEEIHETVVQLNVEGDTALGFNPAELTEFYPTVGPEATPGWVQSKGGTVFRINLFKRKPAELLQNQKKPWDL